MHGLPDYYRGVDIAFQALSDLIVRPRYGEAHLLKKDKTVTANDTTFLDGVTGTGMLYGGFAYLDYTSDQRLSTFTLHIDDKVILDYSFENLARYGVAGEHGYSAYLLKYDQTNFIYSVGILPGITFDESFKFYYKERHSDTPQVKIRIIYALVT